MWIMEFWNIVKDRELLRSSIYFEVITMEEEITYKDFEVNQIAIVLVGTFKGNEDVTIREVLKRLTELKEEVLNKR